MMRRSIGSAVSAFAAAALAVTSASAMELPPNDYPTVSRADYQRLVKAARAEGIKPTKLLHDIAFSAFDRSLYVPADLKAQMRELNFLVFNIANNINQIAHWSNSHAQPADYRRVLAHIETLHQHVVAFTQGRLKARALPPSNP